MTVVIFKMAKHKLMNFGVYNSLPNIYFHCSCRQPCSFCMYRQLYNEYLLDLPSY